MTLILENKKLIFVGGKGGVGKTTVSSSIALHLSERIEQLEQGKILLFSTDPAHSLSDSFNMLIRDKPTPITNTLYGIEINADQLMNEFKVEHKEALQTLLIRGTHLNAQETEQALDVLAMPGIDEFTALIKLSSFIDNREYQTIVVDTAPTGHTIRLLKMPNVVNTLVLFFSKLHNKYKRVMSVFAGVEPYDSVDDFIQTLSGNIHNVYRLITDNEKTEFIIVTIPDLMAIEETKRLFLSLYSSGIKINNMIVNNIQSNLDCAFCRSRRNYQNKYINEIDASYPNINKIYLPLFPEEINGMNHLKAFKNMLFA